MTETSSSPAKGYRKLLAFQAAHDLVKATYEITSAFPKSEQFGLTSQMRRAAVSVAANIVEGQAVGSTPSFLRYLAIGFGSCKELEYYLDLAGELGYIENNDLKRIQRLEGRAAYLIGALSRGLKRKGYGGVCEPFSPEYVAESDGFSLTLDTIDSLDSGGAS